MLFAVCLGDHPIVRFPRARVGEILLATQAQDLLGKVMKSDCDEGQFE